MCHFFSGGGLLHHPPRRRFPHIYLYMGALAYLTPTPRPQHSKTERTSAAEAARTRGTYTMTFCPCTPESLTKAASYGVIDPSKRVTRAELDRCDRLWKQKQQQQLPSMNTGSKSKKQADARRGSIDSQETRVEGGKRTGLFTRRS